MTVVTVKENAVSLEQRITNLVNGMEKLDDIVDRYPGPGFTDGLYGERAPRSKRKSCGRMRWQWPGRGATCG